MAYVTVRGSGYAELVIKKSRFLADVAFAESERQAMAFVEQIRAGRPDANHHVFAFKAGGRERLSDDGEPSGTAGRPVFDVLDKQGLSDTVIVVTRYFGGILLGAGGLVHAYSQAAVQGVESAGVVRAIAAAEVALTMAYPLVGKVQHLLQKQGTLTIGSDFGESVTITCRLPLEAVPALESDVAELSGGRIPLTRVREVQVGADLRPLHEVGS